MHLQPIQEVFLDSQRQNNLRQRLPYSVKNQLRQPQRPHLCSDRHSNSSLRWERACSVVLVSINNNNSNKHNRSSVPQRAAVSLDNRVLLLLRNLASVYLASSNRSNNNNNRWCRKLCFIFVYDADTDTAIVKQTPLLQMSRQFSRPLGFLL